MTRWLASMFGGGNPPAEEAVVWAYRLFLNREPENRAVVERTAANVRGWKELRAHFVGSAEYLQSAGGTSRPSLTGHEPPMAIERVEEAATVSRLLEHVAKAWTHMGDVEPHFSVLTDPRYKPDKLEANLEEFHASGQHDLARLQSALARNGITLAKDSVAFELGCGVGRITHWLAREVDRVVAVDVSANHLALARRHLEAGGANNIEFVQLKHVDDIRRLPAYDLFFSVIVLQHNPPPVIAAILERAFAGLREGGIAWFQVPTYRAGYRFDLASYLADQVGNNDMEMHVLPQREVMRLASAHDCELVEVIEDTYTGMRVGEMSNTFLLRKRKAT
ncbi:MAG TPA: class I SAM-dependent methyltransferase [Dokdonella sp.]|uniref:class I SAM-dependent methyltransferase n=1 Tax=Dokdonella sp. TaxID=2291710 RepID=UPI0025B84114|nr:class I SAM-dependent methyltransferase [Dokdonella sp.]MBX3691183.1 class I SAM-dependent methyltransferase [Dokdonella sp.]MCW5566984.1 class I SAM-dependent methyltransferase [Dokdonella sp.]HNR91004.1 class I SAM-dependent methyltransferase [Dokdonella sp.]